MALPDGLFQDAVADEEAFGEGKALFVGVGDEALGEAGVYERVSGVDRLAIIVLYIDTICSIPSYNVEQLRIKSIEGRVSVFGVGLGLSVGICLVLRLRLLIPTQLLEHVELVEVRFVVHGGVIRVKSLIILKILAIAKPRRAAQEANLLGWVFQRDHGADRGVLVGEPAAHLVGVDLKEAEGGALADGIALDILRANESLLFVNSLKRTCRKALETIAFSGREGCQDHVPIWHRQQALWHDPDSGVTDGLESQRLVRAEWAESARLNQ